MTATYNADKCRQRNRLAARRDEVEAAPWRFLRQAPPAAQAAGLRYAHGTLPASEADALDRINALLPPDAPPLTLEDIYILYAEAANTNYIGNLDARPMFLAPSTLRNVAREAAGSVAFMNGHRTGGLSAPADLPMGKTFSGRYEEYQDGSARAVLGFYMRRGSAPNGPHGPTTDNLYADIRAGTIPDVSVGLGKGEKRCDLCGHPLETRDAEGQLLCPHVPGTTRKMSAEERTAQKARGVQGGEATYSLHDGHLSEVSAVYDGAVPGAGFNKAIRLAREGALSADERAQALLAYGALAAKGDFAMENILDDLAGRIARMLGRDGRPVDLPEGKGADMQAQPLLPYERVEAAVTTLLTGRAVAVAPEDADLVLARATQLQAQLDTERAARAAEQLTARQAQAQGAADAAVTAERLWPAQHAAFKTLYAWALDDDALHPRAEGSRAATLDLLLAQTAPALLGPRIPVGAHVLPPAGGAPDPAAQAARRAELLAASPLGQSVLAAEEKWTPDATKGKPQ